MIPKKTWVYFFKFDYLTWAVNMKKIWGLTACLILLGLVGATGAIADEVDQELIMADGLNCPCKTEVEAPPPPPPPPPPAPSTHDFYIGGGYGASMMDGCEGDFCKNDLRAHDNVSAHDPGYKFLAGYRLHRFLGIEATYYNFGQGTDDDTFPDTFDIHGGSLTGLAILPIDKRTKLFAKGGTFFGEIDEREGSNRDILANESGTSLIVGAGGEFKVFNDFTIRGEVEWFPHIAQGGIDTDQGGGSNGKQTGDIDVLFTSINLIWHFMGQNEEEPILSTGSDLSELNGLYFGGGVLGASWDGGEEVQSNGNFQDVISDIDVGAKGFIGYRFCRYCAVEVGYNYFGDASDDDGNSQGPDTFKAEGVSFSVMSLLPVSDRTTIFAKAGGIYGWLDQFDPGNPVASNFGQRFGEDGLSLLLGGGINFDLTQNISLRGELEFMPDFADGRTESSASSDDDQRTGKTADVDIIATSASLIWWFR